MKNKLTNRYPRHIEDPIEFTLYSNQTSSPIEAEVRELAQKRTQRYEAIADLIKHGNATRAEIVEYSRYLSDTQSVWSGTKSLPYKARLIIHPTNIRDSVSQLCK